MTMKVKELIERLKECDGDMDVMLATSESGEHSISGFEFANDCVYLSGD
jgi:hypothetical protein